LIYKGGNSMRWGIVLLTLLILVGMSSADSESDKVPYEDPSTIEKKNLTFDMQQSVSGTGFFATYRHSSMPDALGEEGLLNSGVEAKNNAHGSGEIDADSLMYAESSYNNRTWINGAYDEEGEIIEEYEETTSVINVNEDHKMTYSTYAVPIGSRYYAAHAVVFNSQLFENTWIKNRNGLNFINNRVEGALGLDLILDASSDATSTSMKLDEDMTQGKAHFAAIQTVGIPRDEESDEESEESEDEESEAEENEEPSILGPAMKAWHNPIFVLDEDYLGTYHIIQNLTMYRTEDEEEKEDAWLPCCYGGFWDMNAADRVGRNAQGVFDCTCFKVLY
jgi:hypothetical protein